ncbi:hypothetical protein B0J15DRAFT_539316 [Fusarium solani]|uniref:FAD-binding PCMH-type domain-containing protein n=1 Tax=Fusarium solani TaxID=169388 RepID=A0A9P9JPB6_FUSSL|nr:uncharacterized protein B0J15DRAFT_539316 [Fusarium solani]KAH7232093.1 hypothetical protein B0J15DRAFT_539316 [Fusarium solani]
MTRLHQSILSALSLISRLASHQTWSRLNESLAGRLLAPPPPGAVCHPGWPTYDRDTCPQVQKNWSVYEFHADNPISVMWDHYTTGHVSLTRLIRVAPVAILHMSSMHKPEHVKLGIDFGSLSIWTHHMNEIVYHQGKFKLDNTDITIPGDAVTIGAGAQMYDVYSATDKFNHTIVGGGAKSVGAGGYITGGGHSLLSARFGLAADQVLQMTLVTPGGKILTVNERNHPDLFWAMRGTHKTPKITTSSLMLFTDAKSKFVYDVIAYSLSLFPSLGDAGLSGYTLISPGIENPVPIPGAPKEVAGILGQFIVQDVEDPEYTEKIWKPINETIQKRWSGAVQLLVGKEEYPSFLKWFDVHYDQDTAGNSSYLVSRLLSKEALDGDQDALKRALKSAMGPSGGMGAFLVAGKGVRDAKPRGGSDAVNPGWRKSYVHALSGKGFPAFNYTAKAQAVEELIETWEPMRKLSPDTGAYINEALKYESNWQKTFWGSNYKKLLSIKKSVDPKDVLWCVPCVGNEGWEEHQDGRLCRV